MSERGPLVLALDVSKSRTGVAEGYAGEAPVFYSIVGRDLSTPEAVSKLGRWLIERTRAFRPDAIYYEAQLGIFPGKYDEETGKVSMRTKPETIIALAKMVGIVEFVADMRSIACHPVQVSSARKLFLGEGNGRLPGPVAKRQAFELGRLMGWTPADHDQGDAGTIWFWGATREAPRLAKPVTPMQQAKAATLAAGKRAADSLPLRDAAIRVDRHGQEHISAKDARRLFSGRGAA